MLIQGQDFVNYTYSITVNVLFIHIQYKDRGGEETTSCHLVASKQTAEKWRAISRAVSDLSPINSFRIQGSRAGVPPRSLPLWSAFGLTEDAGRPRSAVGSRPPPDAFVTLQRDAQLLHHGAKRHALPGRKELKARSENTSEADCQ